MSNKVTDPAVALVSLRKERERDAGKATFARFVDRPQIWHASVDRTARKLRELQQNVIQREHIRRLRAPSGQQQKTGGGGRVED